MQITGFALSFKTAVTPVVITFHASTTTPSFYQVFSFVIQDLDIIINIIIIFHFNSLVR
jgi:hypothetical protein